jgi:hypothetical protein
VHIDHVGRLPYLLAAGYRGPILCSPASAELLPLVLEDALKVGFTRNQRLIKQVLAELLRRLIPIPFATADTAGAAGTETDQRLVSVSEPLLGEPWILDTDVTVKPIYGHQEGAVLGYNPHKPGRPSHSYHTYLIANLRLVLDVEVQPGNQTHSKYSAPGLWELLERIGRAHWPTLIRGDNDWGTEANMQRCEQEGLPYLFKQRLTKGTKRLIERLLREAHWRDAGQGWQGSEASLRLSGWSRSRRVVVLRRRLDHRDIALELKHHWGWGGFTTRDLKRCRFMARITALVYNGWNLLARLAEPDKHLEAITSRPLLLNAPARQITHGRQRRLVISHHHAQADWVERACRNLAAFLRGLRLTAEQLTPTQRWYRILSRALRKYLHGRELQPPALLPAPA